MRFRAADFLSDYVYLTVGKVGSSTDLITQKVVDVSNLDKRRHLIDMLRSQGMNAAHGVILKSSERVKITGGVWIAQASMRRVTRTGATSCNRFWYNHYYLLERCR